MCCLIDGIKNHCPSSLTKLRVHDYGEFVTYFAPCIMYQLDAAPYRSLFSTDASTWSNIKEVEIGLYSWMEAGRNQDVMGPVPYRITQGHHHRDEEEAFDDKTYDHCERNHMDLGKTDIPTEIKPTHSVLYRQQRSSGRRCFFRGPAEKFAIHHTEVPFHTGQTYRWTSKYHSSPISTGQCQPTTTSSYDQRATDGPVTAGSRC